MLFNHVFGKTLRSRDSRVFAVARHPNSAICPVQALDDYNSIRTAIKISVHSDPLFRATDAAEARLKSYLEAAGLSNKPLYSFLCGGALPWHLLEVLWTTSWNM